MKVNKLRESVFRLQERSKATTADKSSKATSESAEEETVLY